MTRRSLLTRLAAALPTATLVSRTVTAQPVSVDERQTQVADTERAFAKTMADRDLSGFTSFLAEEAVFFGQDRVLRGRAEIAAGWKRYFEGPAPFSWAPDRVAVLDSGTLGLSTGWVHDPQGTRVGTFTSTWRLERDGKWRVVFDSGCPPCQCK